MRYPFKPVKIADGPDLLRHLEVYLASLKPIPTGGDFVDGKIVQKYVPCPPSVTGFALHLGRTTERFLPLRQLYPSEFVQCIETIREQMLAKATNKKFVKQFVNRPLLDLRMASTNPQ